MMLLITYQHLKFHFMISRALIVGASAVYSVALILARSSSLVVTHYTADVQVTSERPGTPWIYFQLNSQLCISGSHAAT